MTSIKLAGWQRGMRKISLTKALQATCGLPLSRAKRAVDDVLDGQEVVLALLPGSGASAIVAAIRRLGRLADVVESNVGELAIGRVIKGVTVENTTDRPLTLVLEPWATEYAMAPNQRLVIEAEGPIDGAILHVEGQENDCFVVWAWDGSDARVLYEDGRILDDWTGNRVPVFGRQTGSPAKGI